MRAIIQVESALRCAGRLLEGRAGPHAAHAGHGAAVRGERDSFDPRQNIFGGVKYLRALLDMFNGDTALAAAGYNAGENAVLRYNGVPPYKETRGYVDKVRSLLEGISMGFSGTRTASLGPVPAAIPAAFISRTIPTTRCSPWEARFPRRASP